MKPASKLYVHEQSDTQHRLVVLKSGIPAASPWYEARQVGKFQGCYFHVGAAGDLPPVFRASAVDHEVL
jgi:hypothetical protein